MGAIAICPQQDLLMYILVVADVAELPEPDLRRKTEYSMLDIRIQGGVYGDNTLLWHTVGAEQPVACNTSLKQMPRNGFSIFQILINAIA